MARWSSIAAVGVIMALSANAEEAKDPRIWLEEVTGEKPLVWVKERNAESTSELTKSEAFKALDERLLKILDSKDKIPMIGKHGDHFYNFWRDAQHKRGLWRRVA